MEAEDPTQLPARSYERMLTQLRDSLLSEKGPLTFASGPLVCHGALQTFTPGRLRPDAPNATTSLALPQSASAAATAGLTVTGSPSSGVAVNDPSRAGAVSV